MLPKVINGSFKTTTLTSDEKTAQEWWETWTISHDELPGFLGNWSIPTGSANLNKRYILQPIGADARAQLVLTPERQAGYGGRFILFDKNADGEPTVKICAYNYAVGNEACTFSRCVYEMDTAIPIRIGLFEIDESLEALLKHIPGCTLP